MANKQKREVEWAKAKRVCRLNAETLRMARELGLSPRSLMKNIPAKSQQWKAPVHVWIRDMYAARQIKIARKTARKTADQFPPTTSPDQHEPELRPPGFFDEMTGDSGEEVPF